MKKNIMALAVASVIGIMGMSTAYASTYGTGSAVEVSANIVTPTSVTAQFTPAADSFSSASFANTVTIGTINITSDAAPTGWWLSVPSAPLTSTSPGLDLINSTDSKGGMPLRVSFPTNWQFSSDNGGVLWTSAGNKPSVSFDLNVKGDPMYPIMLKAGKYSLMLNVGSYMS